MAKQKQNITMLSSFYCGYLHLTQADMFSSVPMKENSNKKELIASQRLGEGRFIFLKRMFFHLLASIQAPIILR